MHLFKNFVDYARSLTFWNEWVPAHRIGDTAIGKTFEDLAGIAENNHPTADLHGVELKGHRTGSSAAVTLFNCAPLDRATRRVFDRFAYRDETGRRSFMTTLSATRWTTPGGASDGTPVSIRAGEGGFRLVACEEGAETVHAAWCPERISRKLSQKLHALALVHAEARAGEGGAEFRYTGLTLHWGVSYARFSEAVATGLVTIDFRVRQGDDGRSLRDRGTAFRIAEGRLGDLYAEREEIAL